MTMPMLVPAMLLALPAQAHGNHAMPMNMPMPGKKTQAKAKPAAPAKAKLPAKRTGKTATLTRPAPKIQTHDHGDGSHDTMPDKAQDDGMAGMPMPMAAQATDRPTAPTTPAPPPPEAGTGPARAADAIWGAGAMRASRAELRHENGGQTFGKVMIDRLEYRASDARDGYAWEGQAWYGGDIDKLAIRSEGEGTFGGEVEQVEVQALWSHAIGPWFDLQTGLRHDFAGPARTHAVIGVQGLAPYQFEVSSELFLSDEGDLTARAEAEVDQRITQRLILQPRAELNLSVQDIPELGVGAGLDKAEVGLRLRYEFAREFAPYIGVAQEWRTGHGADYARARGDDVATTNFVFGIRAWF